ncbi:hypothetical protein Pla163_06650 [Planctomycetes bacterium Pla163]|uniref:SWIM-type domain-containing protein n=1 Tax=Rohdeia mirabilis TaxID=2528008 RepID=A0A518CWG0_9BACT|nr:hypothetical protein Pla163_06650 [Planctomycetes bacterium Pla163]
MGAVPQFALEDLERLAPDQSSLTAARKLLKPAKWPLLAHDDEFLWSQHQGSGSTPYLTVLAASDQGYKCTCPSRKFPCKHVLALGWLAAESPELFSPGGEHPQWILDWLSRRRPKAAAPDDDPDGAGSKANAPRVSIRAATAAATASDEKSGPASQERSKASRERNRRAREESIDAGLVEFDRWLDDQLRSGLARLAAQPGDGLRVIARRLNDAKAQGLAVRIESLASQLSSMPSERRLATLATALGEFHLLVQSYRRRDLLDDALRADARRALGWTTTRDELEADPSTERIAGVWSVLAVRDEVQADRLRRFETWIVSHRPGTAEPRVAVIVDYVPVAAGGATTSPYTTGDVFEGELLFHPSAVPLRAVATSAGLQPIDAAPDLRAALGDQGLEAALERCDSTFARLPWLDYVPVRVADVELTQSLADGSHWLRDRADGTAVPLATDAADRSLRPLEGVPLERAFGLWDGQQFELCLAETHLGRWSRP